MLSTKRCPSHLREVIVAGVGMHEFGKFTEKSLKELVTRPYRMHSKTLEYLRRRSKQPSLAIALLA